MVRAEEEAKVSRLFDPLTFCSADADHSFYDIVDVHGYRQLCEVFQIGFHLDFDIVRSHLVSQNRNTAYFTVSFFRVPCGCVNHNISRCRICLVCYKICCNEIVVAHLLLCFFLFLADAVQEP